MSSPAPQWKERWIPLKPEAAAASGETAKVLVRRLLDYDDERLSRMQGATGRGIVVIVGEEDDLPWVKGTLYLGRDARAPNLYLPTNQEPEEVPVELLDEAFYQQFERSPLAVLPVLSAVIPLDTVRPLYRARLQRWLEDAA